MPDLGGNVTYKLVLVDGDEPIEGQGVVDAISFRADETDIVFTVLDVETGALTDVVPSRGDVITDE